MNRSELGRQVAGETGLGGAGAEAAVKAALSAVAGALARGEAVRLAGFGTFEAKGRRSRPGRGHRGPAPHRPPLSLLRQGQPRPGAPPRGCARPPIPEGRPDRMHILTHCAGTWEVSTPSRCRGGIAEERKNP